MRNQRVHYIGIQRDSARKLREPFPHLRLFGFFIVLCFRLAHRNKDVVYVVCVLQPCALRVALGIFPIEQLHCAIENFAKERSACDVSAMLRVESKRLQPEHLLDFGLTWVGDEIGLVPLIAKRYLSSTMTGTDALH